MCRSVTKLVYCCSNKYSLPIQFPEKNALITSCLKQIWNLKNLVYKSLYCLQIVKEDDEYIKNTNYCHIYRKKI